MSIDFRQAAGRRGGQPRGLAPVLRRRVSALWLGITIVCTAAGLIMVWATRGKWLGWLPGTVSASQDPTFVWTCVVAGFGCWLALPLRAGFLRELAVGSARPAQARYRASVVVSATSGIVSYLMLLAAMVWLSYSKAVDVGPVLGWASAGLIAVQVCSAVCWASVGVATARFLPGFLALPIAVAIPYAWNALLVTRGDGATWAALASNDASGWDFDSPTASSTIVRVAWWLALAMTALAVACLGRARLRPTLVCLSVALAATMLLPPSWSPIAGSTDVTCAGEAPRMCTLGSYANRVADYQRAANLSLAPLPSQLRPTTIGPDRASTGPAGDGHGEQPPEPDYPGIAHDGYLVWQPSDGRYSPTRRVDVQRWEAELAVSLLVGPCLDNSANIALLRWWGQQRSIDVFAAAGSGPQPMIAQVLEPTAWDNAIRLGDRLADLPDEQVRDWLAGQERPPTDCELDVDDLPS